MITMDKNTPRTHYEYITQREGPWDKTWYHKPLCSTGNAHEQNNLTKNPDRVDCPNCLEILKLVKETGLPLKDAKIKYIKEKYYEN